MSRVHQTSGLTVGSLRGVPMGKAAAPRALTALPLAPMKRRGCCGTGCVGCPYGDWLRRVRATQSTEPSAGV